MNNKLNRRSLLTGGGATTGTASAVVSDGRVETFDQKVTPIVPGRLYRIGCTVKAERLSWLPADLPGYEPLNAYALFDAGNWVFMEMGAPVMLPAIKQAIGQVGNRKSWIWFSRNEADCIGNMGYLLAKANRPTLLFGSIAGGIFEWINDPAVPINQVMDFHGRADAVSTRNGTARDLGDLKLEFMDAPTKQMYMTQWVFEKSSGTMFTSDSFGFRHLASLDSPAIIDTPGTLPDARIVAREMVEKFNWMREADITSVRDALRKTFAEREVEVLAPVHGCVIKGRDNVAAHVELALEALTLAGELPDTERLYYV